MSKNETNSPVSIETKSKAMSAEQENARQRQNDRATRFRKTLAEYIKSSMSRQNLTHAKQVADKVEGLTDHAVRRAMEGESLPEVHTLLLIATALNESEEALLLAAGYLSAPGGDRIPGIHASSLFINKMAHNDVDKLVVAKHICDNFLLPKEVDHIFVSDGTSTAVVWEEYLKTWYKLGCRYPITMATNNIAAVNHCLESEKMRLKTLVSSGQFDPYHRAMFGKETVDFVRDNCKHSLCILSVTALDNQVGPCGYDEAARAIKAEILIRADAILIVCDAEKLNHDPTKIDLSAANQVRWKELIAMKPCPIYVFTTLDEEVFDVINQANLPKTTPEAIIRNKLAYEYNNAKWLKDTISNNFRYIAKTPKEEDTEEVHLAP